MYKNQKIFFSKPIIPDEVLNKSLIKINKPKPKKQIKKKEEQIKPKSGRQLETEKLLKYYGRNNNMISLLIYLLKRKDESKTRYKTKSTYRMGYKKSQNYQTRTQINKERLSDTRKIEGKKTFDSISKLLNQAQLQGGLGNSRKEQELLIKALKISENYLTNQDYETYGKFLTAEERKNPELIARMKKSAEEQIIKAEEKRKIDLKAKQNLGREQKKLSKEKEMKDYIDGYLFTGKLSSAEFNKIFDDFKTIGLKEPITSYAKSTFNKFLKEKYDIEIVKLQSLSDVEKQKEIEKQRLIKQQQDFWKNKKYDTSPSKNAIKDIRREYFTAFGKTLSKEEILGLITIKSAEPESESGGIKNVFSIEEFLKGDRTNDISGIQKTIGKVSELKNNDDKIKLEKLKKKTGRSVEEEKELDALDKRIKYLQDYNELLSQRQSILQDFIDSGLITKDTKAEFLPDATDESITNDEYEAQLKDLNQQLLGKADTDEE